MYKKAARLNEVTNIMNTIFIFFLTAAVILSLFIDGEESLAHSIIIIAFVAVLILTIGLAITDVILLIMSFKTSMLIRSTPSPSFPSGWIIKGEDGEERYKDPDFTRSDDGTQSFGSILKCTIFNSISTFVFIWTAIICFLAGGIISLIYGKSSSFTIGVAFIIAGGLIFLCALLMYLAAPLMNAKKSKNDVKEAKLDIYYGDDLGDPKGALVATTISKNSLGVETSTKMHILFTEVVRYKITKKHIYLVLYRNNKLICLGLKKRELGEEVSNKIAECLAK